MKMRNSGFVFFVALMIGSAALAAPGFAGEGTEQTADEALALLKEGNARFVDMKMEHPGLSGERREGTAVNGQKPFAVVLGCSDSRVPVEMVFDRGIGDIFVVRVAGNIAEDRSVIGSLEYAAGHVHVPLMVILGHTQCGAVQAAVSGAELEGSLRNIQKMIEPAVKNVSAEYPDLQGSALTTEGAKQNVLQMKKDLLAESKEIRTLAEKGELKIVTAIYDVQTGKVDWFE